MKKILIPAIAVVLSTLTFFSFFTASPQIANHIATIAEHTPAGVFFTPSVTVAELQKKSIDARQGFGKIKILIVPGHEPQFGGAEYRDLKERDIVLKIAEQLSMDFAQDRKYEVYVARDANDWNPILKKYFAEQWVTLPEWVSSYRNTMMRLMNDGSINRTINVYHNTAAGDVATRLYAINKWVDEGNVDIVLHLHINDMPRPNITVPGDYTGFTIYVPEKQYSNAAATHVIADNVFKRLASYFPVSDMPKENVGVVEDQDLIAVGSQNTVDAVSMLIEYGYIYEPMYATPETQAVAAKHMAQQTFLGVEDFFNSLSPQFSQAIVKPGTISYLWNNNLAKNNSISADALALQLALESEGVYPPAGSSKNNCPISGIIGTCTLKAISDFQTKYTINGEEGMVGPETRAKLNQLFAPVAAAN